MILHLTSSSSSKTEIRVYLGFYIFERTETVRGLPPSLQTNKQDPDKMITKSTHILTPFFTRNICLFIYKLNLIHSVYLMSTYQVSSLVFVQVVQCSLREFNSGASVILQIRSLSFIIWCYDTLGRTSIVIIIKAETITCLHSFTWTR